MYVESWFLENNASMAILIYSLLLAAGLRAMCWVLAAHRMFSALFDYFWLGWEDVRLWSS